MLSTNQVYTHKNTAARHRVVSLTQYRGSRPVRPKERVFLCYTEDNNAITSGVYLFAQDSVFGLALVGEVTANKPLPAKTAVVVHRNEADHRIYVCSVDDFVSAFG